MAASYDVRPQAYFGRIGRQNLPTPEVAEVAGASPCAGDLVPLLRNQRSSAFNCRSFPFAAANSSRKGNGTRINADQRLINRQPDR